METFEVVMIGNTAVGKTSMLSALANELDSYNLSGAVALEPTTHEFRVLQQQWNEMLEKVEAQAPFSTLSAGIEGTLVNFVDHEFNFKVGGSNEARVLFTDTRGGMTGELDDKLISRVNEAFGVFCVVDASVLMECPASTNEDINCPKFVKRLLNQVYNDGDGMQPRFVAFVLTKCEKYMASAKGRRDLAKQFHEKYDNLVDMLSKTANPPNAYVLAIQTMGCVSFLKLNDKKLPEFRILPGKGIKTKDCAYPLVIVLKELVSALDAAQGGTILEDVWDWLLKLIGLRKDFKMYLGEIEDSVDEPDLYEEL